MKYLFVLLFFSLPFFSIGQQKKIDSLKKVLSNHIKQDSVRAKILYKLSDELSTYEADLGLKYADTALLLAKKLNNQNYIGQAYKSKAINQYTLGNYSMAKRNNLSAIKYFNSIGDSLSKGKCLFEIGKVYIHTSQLDSSEIMLKKAKTIFTLKQDSLQMAITENVRGITFLFQSKFKESLNHFLNAAQLFDRLDYGNTEHYGSFLSNFGMYYSHIEDYENALANYKKALIIFKKIDQPFTIGNVLNNIGNIYNNINDSESALKYYKEAYDLYNEVGQAKGKANASVNLGIIYFKLGKLEKADTVFKEAIPTYEEWGDFRHLSHIYHNLGRNQIKFFDKTKTKNHLLKAQEYFDQASNYAKKGGDLLRVSYSKTFLADVNNLLGYRDSAKDNIIEAYKIKDSLISYNIMRELTEVEQTYKNELETAKLSAKNEKEKALAEAELSYQKNLNNTYAITGFITFAIALLCIIFYLRRKKANRLKEQAEFKTKVANTELKALRAQMNPHFIFNSLNSINNYLLKKDKKETSVYLKEFASLMRQTLELSSKKEVLLKEDLDLLKSYFEIESKRLSNKFDYKFKIDQNINIDNTLIPPLILQPFVENSIWHGVSNLKRKGEITVEVKAKANTILYVVDDNGIGLYDKKNKHKPMGIQLTENRIEIMNEAELQENSVRLIRKVQGLRVEVELPYKLAY